MGSVAAVLNYSGQADRPLVNRMLTAAPHRGRQVAIHVLGGCALGISNPDGEPDADLALENGIAAAFVGTIDNLPDLAMRLRIGSPSGPLKPAPVLLAAFQAWGVGMPRLLRGMYAVLISDGSCLWCFRDHLGFRSLFYRQDSQRLYVASEAKQVVAGAAIPTEPDIDVLQGIFYGMYDDDTPCALRGVRRLPKASILKGGREAVSTRPYWNPETLLETARLREDSLKEPFTQLMTQAVSRTLTGEDVVSLSGGIDSAAVAAFAAPQHRRLAGRPIAALSAVYPNLPSVDESRYIQMITEFLGIPLHTYEREAHLLEGLPDWVQLLDGPVPKWLWSDAAEHYEQARRLGFRTMLTGEFAEFLIDMRGFVMPHLLARGRVGPVWRRIKAQRSRGASWPGIAWQLASTFVPRSLEAAITRRRLVGMNQAPGWVDSRKVEDGTARFQAPVKDRWLQLQLTGFVGPGLSMEANEIFQALYGIRVRMPWADVDLWEFFLSLPAELKFPDARRKGLVRRFLRGSVPDAILDRQDKTVFNDAIMARIDYPALRRWLIKPRYAIEGIDYAMLAERLRREDFELADYLWAIDLAGVHAFLDHW